MTETERIRRLYDDRAATYDRSIGFGERLLLGRFRHAFGALLSGETIEVGIGSGLNIPFYSAGGYASCRGRSLARDAATRF